MAPDDPEDAWGAHCKRMALATYALAEICDDAEAMERYIEIAARWINLAETPRPVR